MHPSATAETPFRGDGTRPTGPASPDTEQSSARASTVVEDGDLPRAVRWIIDAWAILAIIGTLVYRIPTLARPLNYDHSWASADLITIARTFYDRGVFALSGVPIDNNPPLGSPISAYPHWPPLFEITLSGLFHLTGPTVSAAHAFMLLIFLAVTAVFYMLARQLVGPSGAAFTVLAWLTFPITLQYGQVMNFFPLALFFGMIALVAFLNTVRASADRNANTWLAVGVAAMALTTWSSWEATLIGPGLLLGALFTRDVRARRVAVIYSITAACAGVVLLAWYFAHYPSQLAETWETIRYRMGRGALSVHSTLTGDGVHPRPHVGTVTLLNRYLSWHADMIGPVSLLCVAWLVATAVDQRRTFDKRLTQVVAALLVPWIVWYAFMREHTGIHIFEIILAAPVAALATGWVARRLLRATAGSTGAPRSARQILVAVVLPGFLMLWMLRAIRDTLTFGRDQSGQLGLHMRPLVAALDPSGQFGVAVRRITPPGSVVITPVETAVPMFYSERHMIRGISNDTLLTQAVALAERRYPRAPVFVASPNTGIDQLPPASRTYPLVYAGPDAAVVRVPSTAPTSLGQNH